jgi:hypothetical protein
VCIDGPFMAEHSKIPIQLFRTIPSSEVTTLS